MAKSIHILVLVFGMLAIVVLSLNTLNLAMSEPLARSGADILTGEHVVANASLNGTAHSSINFSQMETCHPACVSAVIQLPDQFIMPGSDEDYTPSNQFAVIPFLPSGLKRPPRLNVSS